MERMNVLASIERNMQLPETPKKRVACNPNGNCWCMQITPVASPEDTQGRCLTPAEMLDQYGSELPYEDVLYLRKIKDLPTYDFDEHAY